MQEYRSYVFCKDTEKGAFEIFRFEFSKGLCNGDLGDFLEIETLSIFYQTVHRKIHLNQYKKRLHVIKWQAISLILHW